MGVFIVSGQGLIIHLPQEKVSKRVTKQGKLLYDLYASPPYLIPSSRCTYYLLVEEISVIGNGYILFHQKIDTRIRKRKEKASVRNTQLYLPIPSAFKGIIKADQQLGSLKIIPSKTSIIKLYHITNSDTGSSKTVGVYNGKINKIAKKNPDNSISKLPSLIQNTTWPTYIIEVENDVL